MGVGEVLFGVPLLDGTALGLCGPNVGSEFCEGAEPAFGMVGVIGLLTGATGTAVGT